MYFLVLCFFFNDTATTEIYTLSLHDALPIWKVHAAELERLWRDRGDEERRRSDRFGAHRNGRTVAVLHRSEEHTSELQSRVDLVCRLLLEKKKIHTNLRTQHNNSAHNAPDLT